ncbi:MAG: acetyl-CoA carboxylase biotin carboxyl carrier protein subunit [Flavobacteriia bacterium]|jgi:biotin carboxyl carrier protein
MANRNWYFDGKEVIGTDGAALRWDDHQFFTLTFKGQKFFGELLENNTESNALTVKINHRVFQIKKKGELDDLISALGLDVPKVRKLKELAAPMPGRIVQIAVSVGQELNPGDEILSLEAMKMENVLKAEGVGTVKAILVQPDQVVEKGSVMIEFE